MRTTSIWSWWRRRLPTRSPPTRRRWWLAWWARIAGALDVGAACTGWLSALGLACGPIESGRVTHALVVGADFLSRFLEPTDRETAPLFADGAGAAVLASTGDSPGRIGPVVLGADHTGADLIRLAREDRIRMQGRKHSAPL